MEQRRSLVSGVAHLVKKFPAFYRVPESTTASPNYEQINPLDLTHLGTF
jgi:hypothetical protein